MAVTAQSQGTLTATGGAVEDTILDVAVAGVFTLHVDLNAMVAGDVVRLRVYQMVLTGGTRRVAYESWWFDAPAASKLIVLSDTIANELTDAGALRFTLMQDGAGTDKAFPWKVLKY